MGDIISSIYWYFTDFCVNMANLLGVTYVEFNIWLFLIIMPGIIFLLLILNLNRYVLRPAFKKRNAAKNSTTT